MWKKITVALVPIALFAAMAPAVQALNTTTISLDNSTAGTPTYTQHGDDPWADTLSGQPTTVNYTNTSTQPIFLTVTLDNVTFVGADPAQERDLDSAVTWQVSSPDAVNDGPTFLNVPPGETIAVTGRALLPEWNGRISGAVTVTASFYR